MRKQCLSHVGDFIFYVSRSVHFSALEWFWCLDRDTAVRCGWFRPLKCWRHVKRFMWTVRSVQLLRGERRRPLMLVLNCKDLIRTLALSFEDSALTCPDLNRWPQLTYIKSHPTSKALLKNQMFKIATIPIMLQKTSHLSTRNTHSTA